MTEPTPADYLDRARVFEQAARHVVYTGDPETRLAVLHLIAHALELTLKAILLREGRTAKELRHSPYGHDLAYMWNLDEVAFLRRKVPVAAAHAVMDARDAGRWTDRPDGDPGALFFEQLPRLSDLHSANRRSPCATRRRMIPSFLVRRSWWT